MTPDELKARVAKVPRWFHSLDLGQGVVTPGIKTQERLAKEVAWLSLPSLSGKRVLDINTWDGFFAFHAERQGAAEVTGLDHFVWAMDLPAHFAHQADAKRRGVEPGDDTKLAHWHPDTLPGKAGFDTAREALGSKVRPMVADFMDTDLAKVGTYEVVFFLGTLYHMANPVESMRRLAAVTEELAVIETEAAIIPGNEHRAVCEFFPGSELNGDSSNWWAPNEKALVGMCHAAGFADVRVVRGAELAASATRRAVRRLQGRVVRYRAVVHARKAKPAGRK